MAQSVEVAEQVHLPLQPLRHLIDLDLPGVVLLALHPIILEPVDAIIHLLGLVAHLVLLEEHVGRVLPYPVQPSCSMGHLDLRLAFVLDPLLEADDGLLDVWQHPRMGIQLG